MTPSAVQRELLQSDKYDEELYGDLREDYDGATSKTVNDLAPDQQRAVHAYAGSGYKYLNRYLRANDAEKLGGGRVQSAAMSGTDTTWQKMADLLHAALDQSTTKRDMVVYRGVQKGALPDLKVGDEITDHGFISTSMDPGEAEGFGGGGGTLFEVSVPAGTNALPANSEEHELVLRPGSTMRVVSIQGGITRVVLV